MWIPLLSTPVPYPRTSLQSPNPTCFGVILLLPLALILFFYLGVGEQLLLIGLLPYYNYNYFIPYFT